MAILKRHEDILEKALKSAISVFYPVVYTMISGGIGVALYFFADNILKYFGVFLFILTLVDFAKREGYKKGFISGYDEGVEDADDVLGKNHKN